ncbi:MAG: hypothetical protein ACREO5_00135 [Candidatus Binatia bacterium]
MTPKPRFKKGQTVYILGQYRAKVVSCGTSSIECDVYEGLADDAEAPKRHCYFLDLVKTKKKKHENVARREKHLCCWHCNGTCYWFLAWSSILSHLIKIMNRDQIKKEAMEKLDELVVKEDEGFGAITFKELYAPATEKIKQYILSSLDLAMDATLEAVRVEKQDGSEINYEEDNAAAGFNAAITEMENKAKEFNQTK